MGDSPLKTISRLAQWRIDSSCPFSDKKDSDPFKLGIWTWHLSVEQNVRPWSFDHNVHLSIRLYPKPSEEPPPLARFFFRVSAPLSISCISSPVHEKILRTSEDFEWRVEFNCRRGLTIDVEFLDLKICPNNGGDTSSIWSSIMQSVSSQSTICCLSRILDESIPADVTINLADGTLRAHKDILSACSPVFQAMFHHNLKEKESLVINIEDMSHESCSALLGYLYGTIKQEDFLKHRLALAVTANKYDILDLQDACEESLLEDINYGNVLHRVQVAWLCQLKKLKKECFRYLFDFGKVYDVRDEMNNLFEQADRQLMLEMFQETLDLQIRLFKN